MKKRRYILFSESQIGAHQNEGNDEEEVIVVALTFPVRVKKTEDGTIVFENKITKNESFRRAMHLYQEGIELGFDNVAFLVGFDYDEAGEEMAEMVREALISEGVPSRKIYRTPLTEVGYVMLKRFANTEKLKLYLYYQQKFMSTLRSLKISKAVGFAKALSLKYLLLVKKRKTDISLIGDPNINNKGTSTATIVTKFITGED